ncbi:hypothetical protein [Poseidonocella sp. HB161398]|uniref:hypothetical protein n=1 Tax=Poseidonocella sp. HB161398 TaxID=2320855 RepID=UPI001107CCDF|nr:hypothetical protein [Poseidonocella sp. HB161398]
MTTDAKGKAPARPTRFSLDELMARPGGPAGQEAAGIELDDLGGWPLPNAQGVVAAAPSGEARGGPETRPQDAPGRARRQTGSGPAVAGPSTQAVSPAGEPVPPFGDGQDGARHLSPQEAEAARILAGRSPQEAYYYRQGRSAANRAAGAAGPDAAAQQTAAAKAAKATDVQVFLNRPVSLAPRDYREKVPIALPARPDTVRPRDLAKMAPHDLKAFPWCQTALIMSRKEKVAPEVPVPAPGAAGSSSAAAADKDKEDEKDEVQRYCIPVLYNGQTLYAEYEPDLWLMSSGRVRLDGSQDFTIEVVYDHCGRQWVTPAQRKAAAVLLQENYRKELDTLLGQIGGGGSDSESVGEQMKEAIRSFELRMGLFLEGEVTHAELMKDYAACRDSIAKLDSDKKSRATARRRQIYLAVGAAMLAAVSAAFVIYRTTSSSSGGSSSGSGASS